jgi:hypothetical protein
VLKELFGIYKINAVPGHIGKPLLFIPFEFHTDGVLTNCMYVKKPALSNPFEINLKPGILRRKKRFLKNNPCNPTTGMDTAYEGLF